MRFTWIVPLCSLLSAIACSGHEASADGAESSHAATLVIRNGTVIDGTGAEPVPDGVVIVRGERIVGVGTTEVLTVPTEAQIVDARGGTILPGIIDAHVHTAWSPEVRRQFLELGVTSICDLGSPIEQMRAFEQDRWNGTLVARGLRAGPIVTAPSGLPDAVLQEGLNYEVGTPAEARTGVADLVRRGADVIKVYLHSTTGNQSYPMVDAATLRAIVEETHRRGTKVRAHVSNLSFVSLALDAGVDVIDHVPKADLREERLLSQLEHSDDPMADLFDLVVVPDYDTLLPRMARQGVVMVPTLTRGLGRWYENPEATDGQRVVADGVLEIVRRWHGAGGETALGTDYNAGMDELRPSMFRRELELLHAAGLTLMQVIETATQNAARVCGHGEELGSIEVGKLADIIVVDGDPVAELGALEHIVLVVLGGTIAHR